MNKGTICFDMDGTIVDLYGVEGWLEAIESDNPLPFFIAKPIWNMTRLNRVLNKLIDEGWWVRVITWLPPDSSAEYKKIVRQAKTWWLDFWGFPREKTHIIAYGTTKANAVRKIKDQCKLILIDDNSKVRDGWNLGDTIDPTQCDLIKELEKLLEEKKNGH